MNRYLPLSWSAILALACSGPETSAPDKSQYHLFHPTPRESMRSMSTDRPDKTESPYTVDAGHAQLEIDLANATFDRWNDERTRVRRQTYQFGTTNHKVGLLDRMDLQVIVEPYVHDRERDFDESEIVDHEGFGDVTTRVKINIWGNDGLTPFEDVPVLGDSALGIMPFLKFPTNSGAVGNDAVEGGVIVPLAFDLPADFSLGTMAEFDVVEDEDDPDHFHPEFIQTASLSRPLLGDLAAYVEFFSSTAAGGGEASWVGTVDAGFTWALTEDVQFDAGVNVGVSRAADDVNPFVGVSVRFP